MHIELKMKKSHFTPFINYNKSFLFGFILALFFTTACGGNGVEKCVEEETCGPVIEVKKVSQKLTLAPDDPLWNSKESPKAVKVELDPQMITNPKWPNPSIRFVKISAVRNDAEIAISLEWDDSSKDKSFGISAMYIDMAAVMFPLKTGGEPPAITMGNEGQMVNIWQWKDAEAHENETLGYKKKEAVRYSDPGVEDLNAEGFSTLTAQDQQDVKGKGLWSKNKWRLVFKRKLKTNDDNDVQFTGSSLMAVAVWNGSNKERNGQKGLAGWLLLKFV